MRKLSGRRSALNFGAALALAALCVAAACSGGGGSSSAAPPPVYRTPGPPPGETPPPGIVRKYVKRVVIIVQENRSFDNLFHGFPGARTARYGYLHDGTKVALRAAGLRGPDVSHVWRDAINDWNHGKMNGFDLNRSNGHQAGRYAYQYVAKRYIKPYWDMAQQYVLADEMFPTMFGGSFTAHLDLIAGTTNLRSGVAEVDVPLALPWGCDAPGGTRTSLLDTSRIERWGGGPFPCFTQFATAADLLDRARVSWAYYAPAVGGRNIAGKVWSEFDAISAVRRGPDWSRNVISPPGRVLEDIAAGHLPRVAWIIPDSTDSDHAGEGSDTGPSWVTSIVNAVGESPYWDSTVILVLWDDWGGWYDSVAPPQLGLQGLGHSSTVHRDFRVRSSRARLAHAVRVWEHTPVYRRGIRNAVARLAADRRRLYRRTRQQHLRRFRFHAGGAALPTDFRAILPIVLLGEARVASSSRLAISSGATG